MNARPAILLAGAAALALWAWNNAQANVDGAVAAPDGEGGTPLSDLAGQLSGALNMGAGMKTSAAGIAAIEQREGFRSQVYDDVGGRATIGYGHLVQPGESFPGAISTADAAALLAADLANAENAVNAAVAVDLTQNQFDALVSFCYNVGAGNFRGSTLLALVNAGDLAGAEAQFARWVYVTQGGQKVASGGLASRRQSEAQQFAA